MVYVDMCFVLRKFSVSCFLNCFVFEISKLVFSSRFSISDFVESEYQGPFFYKDMDSEAKQF